MSKDFFERLRARSVQIHVEEHLRARVERGDKLRVKLGLDPTAPDLHVGHLVVLDTLRMFQDEGHTVVVIIGDYTALIGDPSGRSVTRPMLSEGEIQKAYGLEPQDIAVFPLIEGTDGVQKMSKSLPNFIGLTEPPEEIYGKTMSIPDRLTEKYARLISGLDAGQQADVLAMKPRDAKAALAFQLVKRLRGEDAARRAEADFTRKFRERTAPDEMPEFDATKLDLVVAAVASRA